MISEDVIPTDFPASLEHIPLNSLNFPLRFVELSKISLSRVMVTNIDLTKDGPRFSSLPPGLHMMRCSA